MNLIHQDLMSKAAYKQGYNDATARAARICDDFNMATNDVKERHLILDIQQRIILIDSEKNLRKEGDDMHIPVDTRGNQPSPEIQKESKGVIDYIGLYNELLFAVGNAFPNESRHETALRYIREAELSSGEADGENTDLTEMQARIAQEGGSPV